MFNSELKEEYIEERDFDVILPKDYLRTQFDKLEKYEIEYGKDASCFTVKEIREFYKLLNSSSLEYIASLNSQLSQYTQWCLQNNLVIDNQNHYLEFDLRAIRGCLNNVIFNKKIVTREEVLRWCDEIPNPKDRVIILGLFEGLKGKEYVDFTKLKPSDVNGNVLTLATNRKIKVSDRLISYIHSSEYETKYYPCSIKNKGAGKIFDLVDYGYVIKFYPNVNKETTDYQKGRNIYTAIKRCFQYIGAFEKMTPNALCESGKIHMIKERSKELGMTVKDYIYSDYIKEVEEQFNCKVLRSSFMLKYKDHLK